MYEYCNSYYIIVIFFVSIVIIKNKNSSESMTASSFRTAESYEKLKNFIKVSETLTLP